MKKNVAGQNVGAQLVNASTGAAFTGAVAVAVTVDAGTQATGSVGSGACTHEGNGYHTYAPAQAETDGDLVAFTFTGTGAVPVTLQVYPIVQSAGGRPSVSTDEMATNVVDSGALASTAVAEIAKRLGVHQAGTCQSGSTATTCVLAAGASAVDDFYNGQVLALTEWTAAGQARLVLDYVGATRTATVAAWQTTPDNTTEYSMLQREQYTVTQTQSGLATAAALATVAGYIDTEVAAIAADVTTLVGRLTALRAGYLDNLSGGAVALQASLTSVSSNLTIVEGKIDTIDNFVDTEVASIAADVTTMIGRLTALRAGYLDNLSAGAVAQASALATAQADLTRLLGVHNENARIDNTTYTSGKCTAMRIRVFASAAAANASTAGAADNADSETARYTIAASYTGDELDTYKMVRAL